MEGNAPANQRLILASASPRRVQLLRAAGYEFDVEPADIDEDQFGASLLPEQLARQLAAAKARAIAERFPDRVVLAADTVVAFGDWSLGKPANAEDARRMLRLLSGTTQVVITGVTLACRATELEKIDAAMSAVRMRPLSPAEIEQYVASGQWEGKAGGYGIQDPDPFVIRMTGSQSNVVGLPMELVSEMLAEVGIFPRTA